MQQDILKKLKEKAQYLREWLANYKSAHEVAPEVQKDLDFTEWMIRTVESAPPEAEEIQLPDLMYVVDASSTYLRDALPPMPHYEFPALIAASAFTTSGTASVYEYAARVGDLASPPAIEYSDEVTQAFRDLQATHDRPAEVRRELAKLANSGTLSRFDTALRSVQSYQLGTTSRAAPANDMRNLVAGVVGDLFERARSHPKENMNWQTMALRLAINGTNGPQHPQLVSLEKTHASLVSRLSDAMKDREAGSLTNIADIWAQVQDHLLTLLRFVTL